MVPYLDLEDILTYSTACNIRLLSYYDAQQELADDASLYEKAQYYAKRRKSLKTRISNLSIVNKTYICIGIGMAIQVSILKVTQSFRG